jgi:hypothetical protein
MRALASELLDGDHLLTALMPFQSLLMKGSLSMGRMALLIGGVLGAIVLWPYIQSDERLMWAALLPAIYLAGMWALADG